MKLVIGLGNTGEEYKDTRHNVGCVVVDEIADRKSYDQWESRHDSLIMKVRGILLLAKPQTMMNDSGVAVAKLVNFYKIELNDLYVVYDDLDIALGEYKIQKGKSPHDHNGILSIYEKLGKKDFWHVRVGIENRMEKAEPKIPGEQYVLQKFTEEEEELLDKTVVKVITELIRKLSG